MNALVGYTGFVGSNLYEKGKFDAVYNSKNIEKAYGTMPDLLIYAGLRAEKYLANTAPEKDMATILQAQENIRMIAPKKLVLISTIDVFKDSKNADENTVVDTKDLHPYGYNRYQLECWVRENYPDALIIRLPGLFGRNIKKNFIYDYINRIPFMLRTDKMEELSCRNPEIKKYYTSQDNGFFKVGELNQSEKEELKNILAEVQFSALNFTDSRSRYQFYSLSRLWDDIQICLKNHIELWHPATEPIGAGELYDYLSGEQFVNELGGIPADYNYKTIHAEIFGGCEGYITKKSDVFKEIEDFVRERITNE